MSDRPDVSDLAEILYDALSPAFTEAVDTDYNLLTFVAAIAVMQEQVWEVTHDGDEPWEIVFDPERCPAFALPWLAAFSGVRILPAWDEQQTRDAISGAKNWRRGTLGALLHAVTLTLSGAQTIDYEERESGNAYRFKLRVQADEIVGHPSNVLDAVLTQKPAGIVLDFDSVGGQTYADLLTHAATYADVEPLYPTYTDVRFAP